MKFRRLDTRDGLSNAQLNYLFQDSKGYVWIGTSYGLNRYDGYRFRTFYSNAHDTLTLRSNYVDMIWEDIDGKLWLKQGMNYSLFDPITEKTVRNPSPMLAKLGITASDFLYLGDSYVDIECALKAGMTPVGALWGFRDREELQTAGARYLIARPMELLPLVDSGLGG